MSGSHFVPLVQFPGNLAYGEKCCSVVKHARYDVMGRRVVKTLRTQSNVYVYDAFGRLAAEYSNAVSTSPCVTCYLSYDHLGSVRMVTDKFGAVMSRHDFAPFGQEVPAGSDGRTSLWGSTTDVDPKFTGQLRDTETGEDFFNARYFYGGLTRFLSPDPANAGANLANPQSWNAYAYVLGNPLNSADPLGLGCAARSGMAPRNVGCTGNDGNYGPVDSDGGGGGGVSIDGGSPIAVGTFGGGNPAGGESGVQCPNNVCGIQTSNGYQQFNSYAGGFSGYIPVGTQPDQIVEILLGQISADPVLSYVNFPANTGTPAPNSPTPQNPHSCLAQRVVNAIPGAQLTGGETAQGGHEEFNIVTTPDQLTAAGFTPYRTIFGTPNGYHNGSLFLQVHVNGQNGAQLPAGGSVLNVQGHIDVFNPASGYGLGLVLHTIWDLGVGSLFFRHSAALDPGC